MSGDFCWVSWRLFWLGAQVSNQMGTSIKKPAVYVVTVVQLSILVPIALVLSLAWPEKAFGALVGVSIESVGRAYFAFYAFRYIGAQRISLVLKSFRRGELGKFLLVAMMFGFSFFLWPGVSLPALFAGYMVSWLLGTVLSVRFLR